MLAGIHNQLWLNIGAIGTVLFLATIPPGREWFMWAYLLPGVAVAYAQLAFSNPKEQPNRWDIVIAFPIMALLWPILLLAMLVSQPWNDPKWVNRNEPSAKKPEDQPAPTQDSEHSSK